MSILSFTTVLQYSISLDQGLYTLKGNKVSNQLPVRNFIPLNIKIVAAQVFPVRDFIAPEMHLRHVK